jgi:cell wall-associated NlpC family hydrolase
MAKIPGLPVAFIAAGGVLVFSGVENTPVGTVLRSLARGQAPPKGAPETFATPGTASTVPGVPGGPGSLGSASGQAIAADALRYQGAGYVWDGSPAEGIGNWDCSSFCNWVIGHDMGLAIPGEGAGAYTGSSHGPNTVLWLAWTGCTTVGHDGSQAQAGDLAVWQTHVGICTGPNQMISALNPEAGTKVTAINGAIPEILFIRRLKAIGNVLTVSPGDELPGGTAG